MLLRLTVALLAILAALYFAAPEAPAPSRADLAALRAERQRAVQLTLPERPVPPASEVASAPVDDTPAQAPQAETAPEAPSPTEPAADPVAEAPQPPAPEFAASEEPVAQPEPEAAPAPEPEPEPEAAPEPQLLYVTGSRVNLRAGPSTDNAVRGQVVRGQAVALVERLDNGWVEIRVDGIDGTVFMSGDFLSETP